MQPDQLRSLDDWLSRAEGDLSRLEAIRRLVELGLQAPKAKGKR